MSRSVYELRLVRLPHYDDEAEKDGFSHVKLWWEDGVGIVVVCETESPDSVTFNFDLPEESARSLHAWLGFILSRVDAGELSGKDDDE